MADNKVFDVAPPATAPEKQATQTVPVRKIMVTDPNPSEATTAPEVTETSEDQKNVSRKAPTIAPINLAVTAEQPEQQAEAPAETDSADPKPEAITGQTTEAEAQEPALPETSEDETSEKEDPEKDEPDEAPDTPIKESFASTDALPNDSQRASAAAKETMQDPKIFDTKAYYVPIGNTKHKHTHARNSAIAGFITAAVVLGAVYVYVKTSI